MSAFSLINKPFKELVKHLTDSIDHVKPTESLVPWEKVELQEITKILESAKHHLPLMYQRHFAEPLINNLQSLIERSRDSRYSGDNEQTTNDRLNRNVEMIAGAVYCHVASEAVPKAVVQALRCFLAVVSNAFRSFLPSGSRQIDWLPRPQQHQYPPLSTFRHGEIAPYMLTADVVNRTIGGSVGVVVLPAHFKDHPLLWTAVAHEVGGHELLTAMPQLLLELRNGIRSLFFNTRSLQTGEVFDQDTLIGLLWQYWAEETIADVCGVLHLGPTYGFSLALFQALLYQIEAEKRGQTPDTLLRMWSTIPPGMAEFGLENTRLWDLDPHPVDILKIHLIIGVIENLAGLGKERRNEYVRQLQAISEASSNGQTEIKICGLLQAGADLWIPVNTYLLKNNKPQHLNLATMQQAARRVGAYIATVELNALQGNSLQKLVTWDETDEEHAEIVARTLTEKSTKDPDISRNTNDAHLLAGATLAFAFNPEEYATQQRSLLGALEVSFPRDYYWGTSVIPRFWSYPDDVKKPVDDSIPLTPEDVVDVSKKALDIWAHIPPDNGWFPNVE